MYSAIIRTIQTDGIQMAIIKDILHLSSTRWNKGTLDKK